MNGDAAREEAAERYRFAAFGGLHRRLGLLWPMCPRWYLEKAPPTSILIAKRVIKIARYQRLGDPGAVRVGALTPAGAAMVEQAHALWDHQQAGHERREIDRAKREAK